jgi:ABC-2 type transport system permease protein
MNLRLLRHQLRFELVTYLRNPGGVFFTVGLPVLLLVIFTSLNQDDIDPVSGRSFGSYFVPGMLTFGVISTTYGNLAARLVFRRESGLLKRARSTPLPPAILVAGMLANAAIIAVTTAVLVLGVGRIAYGVALPDDWPLTVAVLFLGSTSFAALGMAMATFVPNVDAADPIAFGTLLPVLFISGVFQQVPTTSLLNTIATLFPVKHLFDAALATSGPPTGDPHIHLLIVGAWGVAGGIVAVRNFRWEPAR